jgi:hypothetical protein
VTRDPGVSKWSLGHWFRQAEKRQLLSAQDARFRDRPSSANASSGSCPRRLSIFTCHGHGKYPKEQ